jgi:hypothetical protein
MKSKPIFYQAFVILVLLATITVLGACQGAGQTEEATSTTATEVETSSTSTPAPTPNKVATQPDYELTTEFVSATEFFRLMAPSGWSIEENIPGADLLMANSEQALNRYRDEGTVASGDYVLKVGFLPLALLQDKQLAHFGFQFGASPEVFLQSLLPMFRMGDALAADIAGEITLISLGDEREAGMLTFSDEAYEGVLLVFEAGDGVLAFVSTIAAPGEMEFFQDVTSAVAAEMEFNGTQDALYGVLYGG